MAMDSSLDLNGLAKSLPAANFEKAEKDLLNNFKAAALSITTLYRSSRHASKRAYNAGYATACQDLMSMIQQGVSTGGVALSGSNNPAGDVMTIGRIMDWIEARMEAVKAREEEEDEDEEREREKERARGSVPASRPDTNKGSTPRDVFTGDTTRNTVQSGPSSSRLEQQNAAPAPLTPHSPFTVNTPNVPNRQSSPTPSAVPPARQSSHPYAGQRPYKSRALGAKKDNSEPFPAGPPITACLTPSENLFRMSPVTAATSVTGDPAFSDYTAGAKRRHAVMMMLDSSASSGATESSSQGSSVSSTITSTSGNARRRTRSSRASVLGASHTQTQNSLGDAMDVEDEGRERKRVARR
ncbi:hypothetical protein DEU56DRAFT_248568 [Suillus clintonianus]|uniref:uncharacterized protein n=1 Tax=Suillus clintonianus TaxID=1904413 RepID=UPI001B85D96E|nr:uncharacterized protein DEU56DRAFT_248568 [Suillus clintonianus]KAG2143734.1 hypothetical protein DEU56DRAFT_248568 [Suillus clintonianus]